MHVGDATAEVGGTAGRPFSVAIVGLGPRGLSVLERLLIRLGREPLRQHVVMWVVDPVEHGSGRVWRTTQSPWFTMNATAGEVTVQSPDSHLGGARVAPPHSLHEWSGALDTVDYPPRRLYGEYLRDVFRQLCASAPAAVSVRPVFGEATGLTRSGGRLCLLVNGRTSELWVDKVVLATGHLPLVPTEEQLGLRRHADRHPGSLYIGEGLAADMPLDVVPPGVTVAVRGLGLTFYDVVRALTLGRGGQFVREPSRFRYRPSGREPFIVAGSRRGLPFLARPRVGGTPETAPHPVVLTDERIAALRAAARAVRGTGQLDFAREVEPLIEAEAGLAHATCAMRLGRGDAAGRRFRADMLALLSEQPAGPQKRAERLARSALHGVPPLDLRALADPFAGERFRDPTAFDRRVLSVLRTDVRESRKGAEASPVKAALEVLRQIRPVLPAVVDFGGLRPASHRDFLSRFEPMSYVLSAGPPDEHVDQLVALVEAGVVRIVGPAVRVEADDATGRFVVSSPFVGGSAHAAEVLVEARAPVSDVTRSASPLIRHLVADGMISEYVNNDAVTGERFATGGLALTRAPFNVIDGRGKVVRDVYAIGVAADRTRWFTQVGTGRPGRDSPFRRDADAIAADILRAARPARPAEYPVVARH